MDAPQKAYQDPWDRLDDAASTILPEMVERAVIQGEVRAHDQRQRAALDEILHRMFANSPGQNEASDTKQKPETESPSGGSDTRGTSHGGATESRATRSHEASKPAHSNENGTRNSPVTDTTGRSE